MWSTVVRALMARITTSFEIRQCLATTYFKVYSATRGFFEVCEVIHEPFSLVRVNVKTYSRTIFHGLHGANCVCDTWSPVPFDNLHGGVLVEFLALLDIHLDGAHVISAGQQTFRWHSLLVMTRDVSKCDLKSLLRISLVLLDEHLSRVFEVWQHVHLNIEKLLEDIFGLSLYHVCFTGNANFIELDSSQLFDPL